ncbi:hypothetical protein J2Z29_002878 [Treponema pedis]
MSEKSTIDINAKIIIISPPPPPPPWKIFKNR